MKIKNLRSYRTHYKASRDVTDVYDEHFIGTFSRDETGKINKRGWFGLYHGDKDGGGEARDGIGNFLKTFLNMAKDGQAVYEFLQNAVDAGSTHLTIGWGRDEETAKEYLLVANNGEMFNPEQVRSILNAGSTTKSTSDIGKFGIGFKLAHRLVGKDNGLDELLDEFEPSGPVLFSWGNNEIMELMGAPELEPVSIDWSKRDMKRLLVNEEPWLFKMLLTCFPCMPDNSIDEEEIKLVDGKSLSKNVFHKKEYHTLTQWVKRFKNVFKNNDYSHGALFFITLGRGKIAELESKNLSEGIVYSLAILNEIVSRKDQRNGGMETVQINDQAITQPDLLFHHLIIKKEKEPDLFAHIKTGCESFDDLTPKEKIRLKEEDDIEFIYGFSPHAEIGDIFKGAPNLYLFFPLSEEVHNFNYILHSNAFDKATSRTFLQAGSVGQETENARLLRALAERMGKELDFLFSDVAEDPGHERFLSLYAALISSRTSDSEERQWILGPYLETLNQSLKTVIPILGPSGKSSVQITNRGIDVRIRSTAVEFDLSCILGESGKWFYWESGDDDRILNGARNKLGIREFDIISLLDQPEGAGLINNWILKKPVRVRTVLQELLSYPSADRLTDQVKLNFSELKLFRFADGQLLSNRELIEVQDQGYLIIRKQLGSVRNLLEKAGIVVTVDDLEEIGSFDSWANHLGSESQLRSNERVIKIFSDHVLAEGKISLTSAEKFILFGVFRKMQAETDLTVRLRKLVLFNNRKGSPVALGNLLQDNSHEWLRNLTIDQNEYHLELNRYLIKEPEEIYSQIIYPLWEEVLEAIIQLDEKLILSALEVIHDLFIKSNDPNKLDKLLGDSSFIPIGGKVCQSDTIFVHENLENISMGKYSSIQMVCSQKLGIQIPDATFLTSYSKQPFLRNDSGSKLLISPIRSTAAEIVSILEFCQYCDIQIFNELALIRDADQVYHLIKSEHQHSFFESNQPKLEYVLHHFPKTLNELPRELKQFSDLVPLKGEELSRYLISELQDNNFGDRSQLSRVLLNESFQIIERLDALYQEYCFDLIGERSRENLNQAEILNRFIREGTKDLGTLRQKIVLKNENVEIRLENLGDLTDKIFVEGEDSRIFLSVARLLGLDSSDIQLAQELIDQLVSLEILSKSHAEQIFKTGEEEISDELVSRFLEATEGGKLKNIDQLALLISYDNIPRDAWKVFKVEAANGDWYDLENNWILPESKGREFYEENYLLSDRYTGIKSILRDARNDYPYHVSESFDDGNQSIIYFDFRFGRGFSPNVFLNGQGENTKFLDYLQEQWQATDSSRRQKLHNKNWNTVLGYDIKEKLPEEHITESETYPIPVSVWINESPGIRKQFMTYLGQTDNTLEIQFLREELWYGREAEDLSGLGLIESVHLLNTLKGMSEGREGDNHEQNIAIDSGRHELLRRLYETLLDKDVEEPIPFPVFASAVHIRIPSTDENNLLTISSRDWQLLLERLDTKQIFASVGENCLTYPDETYLEQPDYIRNINQVDYKFIRQDISALETLSYYQDWSIEHKIKVFSCNELLYEAWLDIEEGKILLGKVDMNEFHVNDEGEYFSIFYRDTISLKGLTLLLEEGSEDYHDDLAEALHSLAEMREKYSIFVGQPIEAEDPDSQHTDEGLIQLQEIINRKAQEPYRKELLNKLTESEKYSYTWFLNFIQLLASFDNEEAGSDRKRIGFQKIRPYSSDLELTGHFFMLEGASGGIPPNIENHEDFMLEIRMDEGGEETFPISGVVREGQDLLISLTNALTATQLERLLVSRTLRVTYTPVLDLNRRLEKAFRNEDIVSPWNDYMEALPPLNFLYGPPGTGKTTKLAEKINELHIESDGTIKILVLVPTNKAGDVLARKILEQSNDNNIEVVRLSSPTDPELEKIDPGVYQNGISYEEFDGINVLITTVHRLPYTTLWDDLTQSKYHLYDEKIKWSAVIFDESSMIGLPHIVFAVIALARHLNKPKFLVSGDPKQIPPVLNLKDIDLERIDLSDENLYKMFDISEFKNIEQIKREDDEIVFLPKQFRSVPEIGNLVSKFAYNGKLSHHRDAVPLEKSVLPRSLPAILHKPVVLIDVPLDKEIKLCKPSKLNYSSYHLYSAMLVADLVASISASMGSGESLSIGIVSPYRAQAALINRLAKSGTLAENLRVYCDTVHGFQGDECDIVIFVINPNQMYYTGHHRSLLSKEYVYNVAISRARDHLWILHPFTVIPDNHNVQKIETIVSDNNPSARVSSSVLEEHLYGNPNYLVVNCDVVDHDDINISRESISKYTIHAGARAIDVTINQK